MKKQIKLTYEWWNSDRKTPIKDEHRDALEEYAENHIFEMIVHGFTSGYLCEYFGSNDEISYHGHWSKNTINVPYVEIDTSLDDYNSIPTRGEF